MLKFENVSTFYGKIQALHSVSVEVNQGEIVTLIGANGAGKSTLLMTLCGSPQAHSGSIRTWAKNWSASRPRTSCARASPWCRKAAACSPA
jgi:ABC-type branched-subunit amino acid transport system ATPase component